jgi:putative transposase
VLTLEKQLDAALQAQLPRTMRRRLEQRSFEIAVDLTEIPYHGKPAQEANEVRRGAAKAGTTHFHSYATLAIVHDRRRYELALSFVWADETMEQVVTRLLERARAVGLRVRRAYLDKGFCSSEVLRYLSHQQIAFLIPIPRRGKTGGIQSLFRGQQSRHTHYTFNRNTERAYTSAVVLVRKYSGGRYDRHGVEWLAYAVCGMEHIAPHQIFQLYRRRFGIESGYRQMHEVRARTTSPSPVLRLLLVGLALLLLNVYITLRQVWVTTRRWGSRLRRVELTLQRLICLLRRTIEQRLGVRPLEQLASSASLL